MLHLVVAAVRRYFSMVSIGELLHQLLQPDNAVRQAAEALFYRLIRDDCEPTIITLFQVVTSDQVDLGVRKLSAVLLRRNLVDNEESVYFKLSTSSQQTLLAELVRAVKEESNESLRLLICDIAGELGGSILDSVDWPELPMVTFSLCKVTTCIAWLFVLQVIMHTQLINFTAHFYCYL
jgi:hypothetical protein